MRLLDARDAFHEESDDDRDLDGDSDSARAGGTGGSGGPAPPPSGVRRRGLRDLSRDYRRALTECLSGWEDGLASNEGGYDEEEKKEEKEDDRMSLELLKVAHAVVHRLEVYLIPPPASEDEDGGGGGVTAAEGGRHGRTGGAAYYNAGGGGPFVHRPPRIGHGGYGAVPAPQPHGRPVPAPVRRARRGRSGRHALVGPAGALPRPRRRGLLVRVGGCVAVALVAVLGPDRRPHIQGMPAGRLGGPHPVCW